MTAPDTEWPADVPRPVPSDRVPGMSGRASAAPDMGDRAHPERKRRRHDFFHVNARVAPGDLLRPIGRAAARRRKGSCSAT